jgi:hypothetical protein
MECKEVGVCVVWVFREIVVEEVYELGSLPPFVYLRVLGEGNNVTDCLND